jgi:hypothetical protein
LQVSIADFFEKLLSDAPIPIKNFITDDLQKFFDNLITDIGQALPAVKNYQII